MAARADATAAEHGSGEAGGAGDERERLEALAAAVERVAARGGAVGGAVTDALRVLRDAFERFAPGAVVASFNGGKDAVVLLHLARVALHRHAPGTPLQCVYWEDPAAFPEVDAFVAATERECGLQLIRYQCSFVEGLDDLVHNRGAQAFLLGTRRCDPNGTEATEFEPSTPGWGPPFMRVNPLLGWEYADVWAFLREAGLPYCELYDRGYTSLGNVHDTSPNPALLQADGAYAPAYTLADGTLERQGRAAKNTKGAA